MPEGPCWVVVQTHPQQEKWAAENIKRQGHEFYLPQLEELVPKGGRLEPKIRPLFPRYLFVRITGQWRFLLGTFGVSKLVMDGEFPSTLPDRVLADIQGREDGGVVRLAPRPRTAFTKGQRVRVRDGVFAGQVGIYEGMGPKDRQKILLEFLGHKTPVLLLEGEELEALIEPPKTS